jgi:membrane protein required for colicin V production
MLTILDFIVLGVMLVSAVLAMVRGFTREVLSIAAWAAAAAATIYFLPQVRPWAEKTIKVHQPIIADVIAGAVIFLVVLILVSLVTSRIADFILDSRIGPLDRTLGFVYGAARGLLLVVVAFLFFTWLVPLASAPIWVQQARSRPMLNSAGAALVALLPASPESTILKNLGFPHTGPAATAPGPAGDSGADNGASDPAKPPNYNQAERQGMQRLQGSVSGSQ